MDKIKQAYLQYLTTNKKFTDNTIESYKRDVDMLSFYLKKHEIDNFDCMIESDFYLILEELRAEGLAVSSLQRFVSAIRSLYAFLIVKNICNSNPVRQITLERSERKVPTILTELEVARLLAQPKGSDFKGLRDKAMIEILYTAGFRVSELLSLNLGDVALHSGIVRCCYGKNDRFVQIYPAAVLAASEYISVYTRLYNVNSASEPLFVNPKGERLTRQGFWKIMKSYVKQAGINKEVTPQTLRHCLAAHLLKNGARMEDVRDILGHTNIASTQFYLQVVDKSNNLVVNYK